MILETGVLVSPDSRERWKASSVSTVSAPMESTSCARHAIRRRSSARMR